jgi:hypothetical protein
LCRADILWTRVLLNLCRGYFEYSGTVIDAAAEITLSDIQKNLGFCALSSVFNSKTSISKGSLLALELAVYRHLDLYRFNSLASIRRTSSKDNVAPILEKTKSIALRPKAIGFLCF